MNGKLLLLRKELKDTVTSLPGSSIITWAGTMPKMICICEATLGRAYVRMCIISWSAGEGEGHLSPFILHMAYL
jgi:hypothetical protein